MASEVGSKGPEEGSEPLDPGWGKAVRPAILGTLIPVVDIKYFVPRAERDKLPTVTEARASWIRFAMAQSMLVVIVILVVAQSPRPKSPPFMYAAITVFGIALGAAIGIAFRKPRIPRSGSLGPAYWARLLMRSAGAMVPVLLGYLSTFASGHLWLVISGWIVTLVMLALIAPTRRNIDRDQQYLNEKGCQQSLWSDLLEPRKPFGS